MKKFLSILFATMLVGQVWAFTAVNSSGKTIYYRITSDSTVEVTYPETGNYYNSPDAIKPAGGLLIPETVTTSNGDTYTVTGIGKRAFYGCSLLTTVDIPNTVTYIGSEAFISCSKLQSVSIPTSVTRIDEKAFNGCSKLSYNEDDGALYLGNGENPYLWLIKAKSKTITSCVINSNCKCIYREAFRYCNNLTTVSIPNSVRKIDKNAFSDCENLEYTLYKGCKYIGNDDNPYYALWQVDRNIQTITFKNDCRIICGYAFANCENLTEIEIPESIVSLSDGAFYNCNKLAEVIIPSTVECIGNAAFEQCVSLTSINIESNADFSKAELHFLNDNIVYSVLNKKSVEVIGKNSDYSGDVVIPVSVIAGNTFSVTSIGNEAFKECNNITALIISESVKSIGIGSFYGCNSLKSLTIGENVKSIGDYAFYGCKGLNRVIIPNSVTRIGANSFDGCNGLETLTIGENVNSIGNYAFSGCQGLSHVIIPNSVTRIDNWAFSSCSNLASVTIPNSVTSIGQYAFDNGIRTLFFNTNAIGTCFSNNTTLERIEIGAAVTNISENAFSGCKNLKSIIIPANITEIGANAFKGNMGPVICLAETPIVLSYDPFPDNNSIYVPMSSVDAYSVATVWKRKEILPFYIVSAKSANETFGSVQNDSLLLNGKTLTITAIPNEGYHFVGWSDGNTDAVRILTEAPNATLIATFEAHTEVTDAAVAATCTATGLTEGSHCSVCGKVFVAQNTIHALGHTEVVDAAVAPTCIEIGLTEGKHCSVCNAVLIAQEEISANGHTEVVDKAIAATCTETGLTEGKHCSVCNEVLLAQEVVPANGHTEVVDKAIAATCTKTGKTEGKHCSVCNAVLVEQTEIPMVEHTIVTDAAVAATATETGLTEGSHCSVCGAVIVAQEVIPALGEQGNENQGGNNEGNENQGGENTNPGTAVAESVADNLQVYAHHNTIIVENATDEIRVYNAMGVLVCRDVACRVRAELQVNGAGVYIVKVGTVAKRVMIND